MPQELYTAQQVADLLGLHVKTVRGYVRDGRLKAVRIGKQYKIARPDLEAFTGTPVARPTPTGPRQVEVTGIVQIDAIGYAEMTRLSNLVTASVTVGSHQDEPLRAETVYNEHQASLKIIIIGGPARTAELLTVITQLLQDGS